MARQKHHSGNWGGARPNSGPKKGNVNRMTQKAIEMVEGSKMHPLQYLLDVLSNSESPAKDRLTAAQACLPYCLTRLSSAEINVNGSLSDESEDMLVNRLLSAQNQLVALGLSVIDAEPVND